MYALLALASSGELSSAASARALAWLNKNQRPDGGWAPRVSVRESTWVTALVALLPTPLLPQINVSAAVKWLVSKTGRESSWMQRMRSTLINGRLERVGPEGWPWFPGTAAWVAPTALTILALRKAWKRDAQHSIGDRIQSGQQFLLSRECADGGWNHGSSKALGYDGPSYPETTGIALAALQGLPSARLARAVERAQQHLSASRSLEASSWLQLGLLAQQQRPLETTSDPNHALSTQEIALAMMARSALRGVNPLEV